MSILTDGIDMSFEHQFENHWLNLSNHLQLNSLQQTRLFTQLLRAYSEPQRHYHTVQHIVECLNLYKEIKHLLDDPIAVELAIWFHDVVYDPQATDNEEKSADLMLQFCANFLKEQHLQKIYTWIIATKKHEASKDLDLSYLLDIDLAILATTPQRFVEYEQQIQDEYAWVPPEIYQLKRAEVLSEFYSKQPLFQTAYFQGRFEKLAKQNLLLLLELNELKK